MLKILLILVITIAVCVQAKSNNEETYDDIVSDFIFNYDGYKYDQHVRPKNQTVISIGISYRQIVLLDEKSGIMTSSFYLTIQWNDDRLSWNPDSLTETIVNGLHPEKLEVLNTTSEIVLPATKIWLPDLAIINTAGTSLFVNINNSNLARVDINGNVYLIISMTGIQTRCRTDTYKYPFDTQNCSIQIGSWQLDTTRIDFDSNSSKIDISDFYPNPLWVLNSITTKEISSMSRYRASQIIYQNQDIYYYVSISRRPLYYFLTFIPCFILNVATLCAFFAHNAINVQISLCMTVFLTFGVYALKINGDMPAQSQYIPLVSIYFIVATVYTLIALIWFIVANYFVIKNRIPRPLVFISKKIQSVFGNEFASQKQITKEASKWPFIEPVFISPTVNSIVQSKKKEEPNLRNRKDNNIGQVLPEVKCDSCNKCEACVTKEDEKKKQKKIFDQNFKILNLLAFLIEFLIMLISNLCIWISVTS